MISTARLCAGRWKYRSEAPANRQPEGGRYEVATSALPIVPRQRIPSDTMIIQEGEAANQVFEFLAGEVIKLFKLMPDGRCQVTGFLYPGQMFGMSCNGQYFASAETIGDCIVRAYSRAQLEMLLDTSPALTSQLLASANDELQLAQDHMLLLGRKLCMERVASFLVMTAKRVSQDANPRPTIHLPMRRSDIADYLGIAPETVSRALQSFKRDGIIRFTAPRAIVLVHLDRLRQLAGEEHQPWADQISTARITA